MDARPVLTEIATHFESEPVDLAHCLYTSLGQGKCHGRIGRNDQCSGRAKQILLLEVQPLGGIFAIQSHCFCGTHMLGKSRLKRIPVPERPQYGNVLLPVLLEETEVERAMEKLFNSYVYQTLNPRLPDLETLHRIAQRGSDCHLEWGSPLWERVLLNCLRHRLCDYDEALDGENMITGPYRLEIFRSYFYHIAAARYPELLDECRRQSEERGVAFMVAA